jgi:hypothetical protein
MSIKNKIEAIEKKMNMGKMESERVYWFVHVPPNKDAEEIGWRFGGMDLLGQEGESREQLKERAIKELAPLADAPGEFFIAIY